MALKPTFVFWANSRADLDRQMTDLSADRPECYAVSIAFGIVYAYAYRVASAIPDSFLEDHRHQYGYWCGGKHCAYSQTRVRKAEWRALQAAYAADR